MQDAKIGSSRPDRARGSKPPAPSKKKRSKRERGALECNVEQELRGQIGIEPTIPICDTTEEIVGQYRQERKEEALEDRNLTWPDYPHVEDHWMGLIGKKMETWVSHCERYKVGRSTDPNRTVRITAARADVRDGRFSYWVGTSPKLGAGYPKEYPSVLHAQGACQEDLWKRFPERKAVTAKINEQIIDKFRSLERIAELADLNEEIVERQLDAYVDLGLLRRKKKKKQWLYTWRVK